MQSKMPNTISYHDGQWVIQNKHVITEQAVTLSVNNESWLRFMCTPIDPEALGVGFLFNESVIRSLEDLVSVRVCPGGDNIDIWLNSPVKKPENWIRTSSCSGSETSIDENLFISGMIIPQNGVMLDLKQIDNLIDQLLNSQDLYQKSGGVHTSALCDGESIIITVHDIGSHNTLDKLAGKILLERLNPVKRIILTNGRVSSEMIQKVQQIGASIAISRTSPTSFQ
jgi:FdhD protein